jgi:hypothetical protein
MSENGETYVEAIFETVSGEKVTLLVENKVRHSISADQLQRYFTRGNHGIERRLWDRYEVIIFAPSIRLAQYKSVTGETTVLSFEDAADFLRSRAGDARSA